MRWFGAFIVGAAVGSDSLATLACLVLPQFGHSPVSNAAISFGLLAVCLAWGFSFISHRFEHQADWFSAKHMAQSLANEPEMLADPQLVQAYVAGAGIPGGVATMAVDAVVPPAINPRENLVKGAEIFGSSLRQLVELTHRSLNKKDWMHPSVNKRVALVNRLAASPEAEAAFDRMERRLRWGIVLFCMLGAILAGLAFVKMPEAFLITQ